MIRTYITDFLLSSDTKINVRSFRMERTFPSNVFSPDALDDTMKGPAAVMTDKKHE